MYRPDVKWLVSSLMSNESFLSIYRNYEAPRRAISFHCQRAGLDELRVFQAVSQA